MRRNHAVFGFEKRIVRLNRLSGYDVKAGCKNFTAVKGICKILFYNQLAAGVVYNDYAILHFGNAVSIDDMLRFREQWAMKCNDITGSKQRVQIHIFGYFASGFSRAAAGCKNFHPKRFCNSSGGLSDPAKTNDSHRFAAELNQGGIPITPIGTGRPLTAVDSIVMMTDMVADLQ